MPPPDPGRVETLDDGLRRILAPNPGPMTHWGTNTFILGEGSVAVVDPGPDSPAHLAALLAATRGETITHILVTHAHADHSPLARALANATGAPILGFGPPEAGRSPTMDALAREGRAGGGEGVDQGFQPDQTLGEGDLVAGDGWTVAVLHTPGHFAGHLAFQAGNHILSGDHVMDWSSSLVSPPDGDIRAFMETSERLAALEGLTFHPGHGKPIDAAPERLAWLIQHRLKRETGIRETLGPIPQDLTTITERVYTDIPPAMQPAAARNVLAHLIDLVDRNLASASPKLGFDALFTRN